MALSEISNPLNGKLSVLSFGAGAIGTYIGGSLALAGTLPAGATTVVRQF